MRIVSELPALMTVETLGDAKMAMRRLMAQGTLAGDVYAVGWDAPKVEQLEPDASRPPRRVECAAAPVHLHLRKEAEFVGLTDAGLVSVLRPGGDSGGRGYTWCRFLVRRASSP